MTMTMTTNTTSDEGFCTCPLCSGKYGDRLTAVMRGQDEYAVVNGRVYTGSTGSEGASFWLHESVSPRIESGAVTLDGLERDLDASLWPLKGGIFTAEDVVDLYRAMMRERQQ